MRIHHFNDFCAALLECGFSMGSGNDEGIFTLTAEFAPEVRSHTGLPDTDPWEWRMRMLEERNEFAYAKLFFRKGGWITKEWYPCFYAVRRDGGSMEEAWLDGTVSQTARRVYEIIARRGNVPLHEIKALGGFTREEGAVFERAIVELQMRMFITIAGRAQKVNRCGESYGWSSTVFATVEDFWAARGLVLPELDAEEARERIRAQIYRLNPLAEERAIAKFIKGGSYD